MAASAVSICSNALLLLGAKPINSLTDGSDGALLAQNLYPTVSDALLRAHPWNSTLKRVVLAPKVGAPAFDYAYAFALPGDWIRTWQVGERGARLDYRTEGRDILSDTNPLPLVYQRRPSEGDWDSQLLHLATLAMAASMAYAITKSNTVKEQFTGDYRAALIAAMATDGQDDPPETLGDSRLLAAGFYNGNSAF